jgi:hypothetical protein
MSNLIQQEARPTRLRDYGAFQTDLSAVDTLYMSAIEPGELTTREYLQSSVSPHSARLILPQNARTHTKGSALLTRVQRLAKHQRLIMALRLIVAVALLAYLFRSVSWQTLFEALTRVHPGTLLVGLIIGSSGIVLSAYQW